MPAPATPVSAADMRSILDPLDALGMEDEYRRAVSEGAGGITTSVDALGLPRGIDSAILDGFEEQVFDAGEVLPMERVVGTTAFKGSQFIIPPDGDGPLASDFPNELGPASNHEKRILFDCQGRPNEVQFAKLRHYLTKPCNESHHKHRAFYPTLDQAVKYGGAERPVVPFIACRLPKCPKKFDSEAKRDLHFRNRHPVTFQRTQDERRIKNEDMQLATNEGLLKVLQTLAGNQVVAPLNAPMEVITSDEDAEEEADFGGTVYKAPSRLPAVPKAKAKPAAKKRATRTYDPMPEGNPDESWKVYNIKEWVTANGHPLPDGHFRMTKEEWLAYAKGLLEN